jgi:hypothetical protein
MSELRNAEIDPRAGNLDDLLDAHAFFESEQAVRARNFISRRTPVSAA